MSQGKRYVLLDRDGTIIVDKHYLSDPAGVELLPGAAEGLRRMQSLGFGLAVLSNQSGIGRGYFDHGSVEACNRRLAELLAEHGVTVDGFYYCPHGPEEGCSCRKPGPGLMERAARELEFDPGRSWMIGDKCADMGLGRATGAGTILVLTGKGEKHRPRCVDDTDHVAVDLTEAADIIESRQA
jgi:D-glycero-D-manno-heptose 1,7-bisphosphate phosphatase